MYELPAEQLTVTKERLTLNPEFLFMGTIYVKIWDITKSQEFRLPFHWGAPESLAFSLFHHEVKPFI
jgi:hypothetical protein